MSTVIDDEWLPAINGLMDGDAEPMAAMLRGPRPLPQAVKNILAEMLFPYDRAIYDWHLQLTFRKTSASLAPSKWFNVEQAYLSFRSQGLSSEKAAIETGEQFGIDARTVMRYRKSWREFGAKLALDD